MNIFNSSKGFLEKGRVYFISIINNVYLYNILHPAWCLIKTGGPCLSPIWAVDTRWTKSHGLASTPHYMDVSCTGHHKSLLSRGCDYVYTYDSRGAPVLYCFKTPHRLIVGILLLLKLFMLVKNKNYVTSN